MFTATHALINAAATSAARGPIMVSRPRRRRPALARQDAPGA
jgi:hypothetical protein